MSTTVQEIKRRCPSALWARGEKLANARAVTIAERGEEEIEGTVLDGRNLYEVVVYPQDGVEWDCNCGSAFDACEDANVKALDYLELRRLPPLKRLDLKQTNNENDIDFNVTPSAKQESPQTDTARGTETASNLEVVPIPVSPHFCFGIPKALLLRAMHFSTAQYAH